MRTFYTKQVAESDEFIAIREGEQGFYKSTVYDQDHATALNEKQGITQAMCKAAITCSMFECWVHFNEIAQDFERGEL